MESQKSRYYLVLFLLACSTAFSEQTDAERKAEATEKQHTESKNIKEEFSYSFNDIRDHLVLIEHENGMGSRFVAKMGDHYYLLTNQHVIFGANKINFKSVSGKQLHPIKVELSATRDIARLLLEADDGLAISGNIEMDAPVGVFGNSDGAGVATELYGRVNGIGGDLVEVSADFISGNSGSPVLNLDQEVIGMASYVRFSGNSRTKKGTQFENKTRRFCYRITDAKWISVNWGKYNNKYGKIYLENEQLIGALETIYSGWQGKLTDEVHLNDESDIRILSWSQAHNKMRERCWRTKKFREGYTRSLKKLAGLCNVESKNVELLLNSEEKYLTDFLSDGFKRQAQAFRAYEDLSIYVSDLNPFQ